jgi:hypothetical protein
MKLPYPNLLLILNVNVLCMTTLPVMSAHANVHNDIRKKTTGQDY